MSKKEIAALVAVFAAVFAAFLWCAYTNGFQSGAVAVVRGEYRARQVFSGDADAPTGPLLRVRTSRWVVERVPER